MLPRDVLTVIFNNLSNKKNMQLSFVCKYFYEIVSDDIFWIDKTKNIDVFNTLKITLSLIHRIKNKKLIHKTIDKINDIYSILFIDNYIRIEIYGACYSLIYDDKLNFIDNIHDENCDCDYECDYDHECILSKQDIIEINTFIKKRRKENIECRKSIFKIIVDNKYKSFPKNKTKITNTITNEILNIPWINNNSVIIKGTLLDISHNKIIDLYELLHTKDLDFEPESLFDINETNIITEKEGIIKMYEY